MKPSIILSLAMLAPGFPAAFAVLAPAHARQAESRSPDETVRTTIERVMSAIRSDPGGRAGDPERIYQLVQQHFLPATDFALTTQYAVGEAWASATPRQREELVRQFQTLLARTFALQLTQIHEQDTHFTYAPAARLGAGAVDAVVKTRVRTEGELMPIDYRLRKTGAGWKIYDINMMGAWMIQVYRRQFAARLASSGVDGLIRYLAAHNAAV